jgi:glycosyltransferase involved in cell wall biosynthesis
MTQLVAPENDYRSLRSSPDVLDPTVTVIIPVYNRPALLSNVLAGLAGQSTSAPFDVVAVDDGSEEDISSVVDRFAGILSVRLIRQERDGFGLARARNLGLSATDADVVVFLDADCIPGDGWLESHIFWHRKASNVVVTGSRRHVDVLCDPDEIVAGATDLSAVSRDTGEESGDLETDDWRGLVYRRSQRLLLGDAGFRAAIGGNSSVRRDFALAVGGVSEEFRGWGGEDTEFAWRLWNAGAFIIPEDSAIIYHQSHGDPADVDERRQQARQRALPLIADRVPHRFYRKTPSHLHTVPKVSWIVTVETVAEAKRAWQEVSLATYTDSEILLVGAGAAVENWVSSGAVSSDLSVVSTFAEAVAQARGEMLAIVDGRARFDRKLLARTMPRFDDGRVSAMRVGYRSGGARLIRLKDLRQVDAAHGRGGLPLFGLIRRREILKDPDYLSSPGDAWIAALDRSRTELFVTDLVEIPKAAATSKGRNVPGMSDLRAAGATEIARGVKRAVRLRKTSVVAEPVASVPDDPRIQIEYVGFTGQQNLGDDAMLEAVRRLMPWANIGTQMKDARVVMLGGGTLFNSTGAYLRKMRHLDGPNMERIVFGTGVRSPDFWGITEPVEDWDPFLDSSLLVGVRGPDSVASMRGWGYGGPAEIIGDPALSLVRPERVETGEGRVVVCPLHTGGELWGGDDEAVFNALAVSIARLKAEGRDVVMLTAHPSDDRWAMEIMRHAGHPDLAYVAGYNNLDDTLRLLASADLVVGERLHAVVLAAAMGTPFVALEYRPKVLDFARSISSEEQVLRTDQMAPLDRIIDRSLGLKHEITEHLAQHVSSLVARQHERAAAIATALGVDRGNSDA